MSNPTKTKPPNIVFILSDDQGAWALGSAGNRELRTPNLDRMAREGTRFENFFCVSPVCSPARASIITGRIPSQHGVHDWIRAGNIRYKPRDEREPIEYLAGLPGFPELLKKAGYTNALSGKWHLGMSAVPQKGFDTWQVHAFGGGPYYGAPMIRESAVYEEPRYVTDVITDNAIGFLESPEASEGPFYLSVHYTAPHSPWTRENHPAEVWDDYYENCPFESTPVEPMHPWKINAAPGGTGEERRRALAGYFTAIQEMDRNIGRVFETLEERGFSDNTLVVFTSDNGMNMGHHGIWGKGNGTFPQNMYDTSVKVPTLAWWPGRTPAGRIEDRLLSHYDIMPTLLELAGVENPEADELPGSSFAEVLTGAAGAAAERAPGAGRADGAVVVFDEYGPTRMIRTREWKYVHRYPYGPHELYNLAEDPGERRNLVREAAHRERVVELRGRLDSWFVRYADPRQEGTREAVTGKGQIDLVGPAAEGRTSFVPEFTPETEDGDKPMTYHSPFRKDV